MNNCAHFAFLPHKTKYFVAMLLFAFAIVSLDQATSQEREEIQEISKKDAIADIKVLPKLTIDLFAESLNELGQDQLKTLLNSIFEEKAKDAGFPISEESKVNGQYLILKVDLLKVTENIYTAIFILEVWETVTIERNGNRYNVLGTIMHDRYFSTFESGEFEDQIDVGIGSLMTKFHANIKAGKSPE